MAEKTDQDRRSKRAAGEARMRVRAMRARASVRGRCADPLAISAAAPVQHRVMAWIGTACIVTAYIAKAYVVMAYIFMGWVVFGLCSYGRLYSAARSVQAITIYAITI